MDTKGVPFLLEIDSDWYKPESLLLVPIQGYVLKVLSNPKRRWYQVLLQWVSFGKYKAPYIYLVSHVL